MDVLAEVVRKMALLEKLDAEGRAIRAELSDIRAACVAFALPAPSPNSTDMAADVLVGSSGMHINDIIAAIRTRYSVEVRYPTLVGNLSRLVKKGRRFRRVAPNVFALL